MSIEMPRIILVSLFWLTSLFGCATIGPHDAEKLFDDSSIIRGISQHEELDKDPSQEITSKCYTSVPEVKYKKHSYLTLRTLQNNLVGFGFGFILVSGGSINFIYGGLGFISAGLGFDLIANKVQNCDS